MSFRASVQPESGRTVYAWVILCKTDPDPIWMAWSWFCPNASGLEASWCLGMIWTGFWQDATGLLPVSHFQTRFRFFTDVLDNIVETSPDPNYVVLADCVRFWPNGSDPKGNRCTRIIRPASGQCFPANPDRMWIESGMFTGWAHKTHTPDTRLSWSKSSRCQQTTVLPSYCLYFLCLDSLTTATVVWGRPTVSMKSWRRCCKRYLARVRMWQ